MDCYSWFKKKEIQTQATTWLVTDDTKLSEISQSKDKLGMTPYAGGSYAVKLPVTEIAIVAAKGAMRGNSELFNRSRVSTLQNENS